MKYRLKQADGTPVTAIWRILGPRRKWPAALPRPPAKRSEQALAFAGALAVHPAPACRTHSGRRRKDRKRHAVQLLLDVHRFEDSLDGIFSALREAALTLHQAAGIGLRLSTLRPKARRDGLGRRRSGPVSFIDVCDRLPHHLSGGLARGAMMATWLADHPVHDTFIAAKTRTGPACRTSTCSVLVSDAFMAREGRWRWELKFGGQSIARKAARIVGTASCSPHLRYLPSPA